MKRLAPVVAAAVIAAPAGAQTLDLSASFAGLRQPVLAAAAAQKQASAALPAAPPIAVAPTLPPQPARNLSRFYLEYGAGRWQEDHHDVYQLLVEQGDHVIITLAKWTQGNPLDQASFDVDGLDAVVNGDSVRGIHVWLREPGTATVEFDAIRPGIYQIYGRYSGKRFGQIVVIRR